MNAEETDERARVQRGLAQRWGWTVLAVALHVAALRVLTAEFTLSAYGSFAAFAAYFVVLGFLLNAIEGVVFTEGRSPVHGAAWLGGIVFALVTAAVAAGTTSAGHDGRGVVDAVAAYSEARGPRLWLHVAYASISYMVAYCVIGSATWPFVRSYYESRDSPLRLRVPSGCVILPLQLARGSVATLALLPLFAGLAPPTGDLETWLRLALTLTVTCSLVPMMSVPGWPLRLRVLHAVEITVFACVQGFAWWWFLMR